MIIDLNILPNTVKETTIFSDKSIGRYPVACVGEGSYVTECKVECGEDGISNLHIGKFCAVAHKVTFEMDLNHDYKSVAIGECDLFNFDKKKVNIKRKGQIILQNDVWIGRGATIMPGVIIHNGGIVAANSHVVKDVPPYAIVGGNPAKIIGYRFDDDIIKKMLNISWWYWDDEKIKENSKIFNGDINTFCDMFYTDVDEEKRIEEFENLCFKNKYLFFMDHFDENSLWQKVMNEFIASAGEEDFLLFYVNREDYEANEQYVNKISDSIDNFMQIHNKKCKIEFYVDERKNNEYIFRYVDYLITNRGEDTVKHTCYADKYNVKILSGVDEPILVK